MPRYTILLGGLKEKKQSEQQVRMVEVFRTLDDLPTSDDPALFLFPVGVHLLTQVFADFKKR